MKTASFQKQLLCGAIMATSAFAQVGCRTGNNLPSANLESPSASTIPNMAQASSIQSERIEAVVFLSPQPMHFSFRVGEDVIGTNKWKLIEHLQARAVTDVCFSSEYKMTPEDMRDYVRLFESAGIRVREFWVPRSSPSGRLDLCNELPPKWIKECMKESKK